MKRMKNRVLKIINKIAIKIKLNLLIKYYYIINSYTQYL